MENIMFKIENYIKDGLLDEAESLICENKDNINYDEIASMEAIINLFRGNIDEAMNWVRIGLKNNITNSDLYYNMGLIYEALKEYDRAYLSYEQAVRYVTDEEKGEVIIRNMANLKQNYNIKVKPYSVVMLTHNNIEYTKLCIQSLRLYDVLDNYEIIIVDNNSTDGTVEWLKEQKGIKYILNNENRGFPAACNQGIEIANKENDIFLLNNDTIIMQNSVFNLRMGLYSNEKVGATGAVSNNVSNYQRISEEFNDFNGYERFAISNNISNEESYKEKIKLVGFAMLIKRHVLDKVGLLDERFSPGNFEDDDISYRIIKEGYKLLLCTDSYIHHFGSATFKKVNFGYSELLKKNSAKFKEKWGFSSEYSSGIRFDLINNIEKDRNEEFNVLEVGCACGASLLEVKNRYPNAKLYGIEIDKFSASIAKKFADVRAEDIEKSALSYEENFFDYIILGDVLEHLIDPGKVLENLKKYLKEDGKIISSIPNIMHFTVVRSLMNGRWKYEDAGILDKTHLRFFTKAEIIDMFGKNGFNVVSMLANKLPERSEDIEFVDKLSALSDLHLRDEFLVYQYVTIASKKKVIDFDVK